MRRRLLGLAGCTAGALMLSAMSSGCQTMTQSKAQNAHLIETVYDYQARQLADDVDYVLLIERPSRLTKWFTP